MMEYMNRVGKEGSLKPLNLLCSPSELLESQLDGITKVHLYNELDKKAEQWPFLSLPSLLFSFDAPQTWSY